MNWNKYSDETLQAAAKGCMTPTLGFIILLTSIIWLCGCKTKEYVYVEKTDTMYVHKTDTIKDVQVKVEKRDSIVHDSVVEIRDVEGKTIYKEVWKDRYINVYKYDSLDFYKAKCDSLMSAKNNIEQKEKVITKTNYSGWWAFGGLVAVIVAIVIIVVILRRK